MSPRTTDDSGRQIPAAHAEQVFRLTSGGKR